MRGVVVGLNPNDESATSGKYLFSVAAGVPRVPPAVEPGILPGGFSCGFRRQFFVQSCHSGQQNAALYGSQDGCRYSRKGTLDAFLLPSTAGFFELKEGVTSFCITDSVRAYSG